MTIDSAYRIKLRKAHSHLEKKGVHFHPGLNDSEISEIENYFCFSFPPDLKWFLKSWLPVDGRFPNWRGAEELLWDRLEWPIEGICFDIKNGAFWWHEWGDRPSSHDEAVDIAKRKLADVPKVVPIYGHSYLAVEPNESANPVFSIHQGDVIHRGGNLAEYLLWAFHDEDVDLIEARYPTFSSQYKHIAFWTDVAKKNAEE